MGEPYFVRVAVHTQSGSGTFSSWARVTTYEGESNTTVFFIAWLAWADVGTTVILLACFDSFATMYNAVCTVKAVPV